MADDKKHGRHCYQIGCDCPERKIANAAYAKAQRDRGKARRAELAAASPTKLRLVRVPTEPVVPAPKPVKPTTVESDGPLGRVGRAVLAEISAIDGAVERHPGLVAIAVSMAGLIDGGDSDRAVQAAKEIKLLLAEMRPKNVPIVAAQTAQQVLLERLAGPLQ